MGHEANIDAIRVLERHIEEGDGDTIQLKRVRNSLLNISARVPAEILGDVFFWSVFREEDHSLNTDSHFTGVRKGSYNFLLVCHHWFEVAISTPELWNSWGATLSEWKNRHSYPGVVPLDLVLHRYASDHGNIVDEPLQDALRNRAMQDTIRQIHLGGTYVLQHVISSLTPNDEGVRCSSIESIDLRAWRFTLDISDFFARHHLPKLRSLFLHGALRMLSWDWLVPHTTLLTTLSLDINESSPTQPPITSQLLSILVSNPNLRELLVTRSMIPKDDDRSTFQVPMPHLKELQLTGEFRQVFRLLDRLTFPGTLDRMLLTTLNPAVEDVLPISGPYLRGYIRRHHKLQDELEIDLFFTNRGFFICANAPDERHLWNSFRREPPPSVELRVITDGLPPSDVPGDLCLDLAAFTPRERVLCLKADFFKSRMEDLLIAMPNIEALYLSNATLSKGFLQPNPDGPHANMKLLPSLRSLSLDNINLLDDDWGHLTTYLAHQISDNQTISLETSSRYYPPHLCPEVVKEVEDLVGRFYWPKNRKTRSPFGRCEESGRRDNLQ
jgi:hypothetical protein